MNTQAVNLDKAFDVAIEIDKQITAIATAVLALTAVFFQSNSPLPLCERRYLGASWVLFGLAVLMGVVILMISTAALLKHAPGSVVQRTDIRVTSALQIIFFMLAVVCMVVFAILHL